MSLPRHVKLHIARKKWKCLLANLPGAPQQIDCSLIPRVYCAVLEVYRVDVCSEMLFVDPTTDLHREPEEREGCGPFFDVRMLEEVCYQVFYMAYIRTLESERG